MGSYNRYPPEVHEFVKKWAPKMRDRELAAKCNAELGTAFTASSMKSFRYNHGYRNFQRQYSSDEYWKYQTKWPPGMFEYIRDNSWGVSSAEMAERVNAIFGTSFTQHRMKVFRAKYKIKSGCTGWYQRGHAPGNKGKKLEEYVGEERAKDIKERIGRTKFKKGHKPANLLPVGSVSVTAKGHLIRKVSETGTQWERWKFVHRLVWEEHHGAIPDGMIVTFKDGNPQNCDISNLMLASKGEMSTMMRKGFFFDDPDLRETALHIVRLMQAANKRRRKNAKRPDGES